MSFKDFMKGKHKKGHAPNNNNVINSNNPTNNPTNNPNTNTNNQIESFNSNNHFRHLKEGNMSNSPLEKNVYKNTFYYLQIEKSSVQYYL